MAIPEVDGVYGDIDEAEYHADLGSLSSSGARTLLSSPAKFRYMQDNREEHRYFDVGRYVHSLLLGKGAEVVAIDAPDYKTKAAQQLRDEAYADGLVPLLNKDANLAEAMADQVRAHPTAAALLDDPDGAPELSLYWHDALTGVRLRARIDWLTPGVAVDVKTTAASANPTEWGTTAAKYKLQFQGAWYLEGLRALDIHNTAAFVFINVEKDPPHLVSLTQLTERAIELGAAQMRRAIDVYAKCVAADDWPAYGNEIHTVELPRWAYYQEQETYQ